MPVLDGPPTPIPAPLPLPLPLSLHPLSLRVTRLFLGFDHRRFPSRVKASVRSVADDALKRIVEALPVVGRQLAHQCNRGAHPAVAG